MARTLKEFPASEAGPAIAEKPEKVEKSKEKKKKVWLPLEFKENGEPDTDKLPPAVFTEKVRALRLADGSTVHQKQPVFVRAGEPRYAVNEMGELQAWYHKRGGVGRKLVWQFKREYPKTDRGNYLRQRDAGLRKELRSRGIPGA